MNHSPGPWTAFYKNKYDEWHVAVPIKNSNALIPLFPDGIKVGDRIQRQANARLIAAAPDMLEALKEVYSAWRDTDNVTDPEVGGYETLNKIKSVIERATGCKIEEVI